MRLHPLGRALFGAGAAVLLVLTTPAVVTAAAPDTDFEMPFPCGQDWKGTTRKNHSPSSKAVDWNRADDLGDPVVAAAGGVVTTADDKPNSGYGRWVVIDHGNGETSLYAHMQTITVAEGQRVDQGAQIGTVGSTGNSTGAHLHFEERSGSKVLAPFFNGVAFAFGTTLRSRNCVDVPLAADWTGDGVGDLTVFRRRGKARFLVQRPGRKQLVRRLGKRTDEPVIGDWEGDGKANPGVYRPHLATFILRDRTGKRIRIALGDTGDLPVAGDWDGNGRWEVGVWKAARNEFTLRAANGSTSRVRLGDSDDLPLTGDWDGDGRTDLGVYDPTTSTFTLRKVDEEGTPWIASIAFGSAGDLPVTGDWDGNGRTDLAVWSPVTGRFTQRFAPSATQKARKLTRIRFGHKR